MMNSMMNAMVSSMSVKDRKKMVLDMMPDMMKQADIKILMANMAETLGKEITLQSVYSLLSKILEDPDLKKEFGGMMKGMKSKMPDMMPMMMPVMEVIMPKMMGGMMPMMGGMMPMMGGMMKEMAEKEECVMTKMVDENSEIKEHMGNMMFAMCHKMAGKVIPDNKREEFVKRIEQSVINDRKALHE